MNSSHRTKCVVCAVVVSLAYFAALPMQSWARLPRDAVNPSLCMVIDEADCPVPGGTVSVALELGAGDPAVTSGQFLIAYDPANLQLRSASPGIACDPSSPFSSGSVAYLDETNGELFYLAFAGLGTQGPATVACFDFIVVGDSPSDVCLMSGYSPYVTRLVDDQGYPVPPDNSEACPASAPALSCDSVSEIYHVCTCDVGTPDCTALDDDCNVGFCDDAAGQCDKMPANEGGPCDDGSECTTDDHCVSGWCFGTDCTDPSLCLLIDDADCPVIDGIINVTIELGTGDPMITGGQFAVEYDPVALQFHGALPGSACDPSSPFNATLTLDVNEETGELFHVVTATPGSGTQGPATMSCLSFLVVGDAPSDICLVPGGEPKTTYLLDDEAGAVTPYNRAECPTPPPSLSCDATNEVSDSCTCDVGTPNCTAFDDDCNVGVCTEAPARCEQTAANETEPCDDGNDCTMDDQCLGGFCVGSNCPDPSLCMLIDDADCPVLGGMVNVTLELGAGDPVITGGQFAIEYDPVNLQFHSASPGSTCDPSSPFSSGSLVDLDETSGEIFYLASAGSGTQGPATVACFSFVVATDSPSDICLVPGESPQQTRLIDDLGYPVTPDNGEECPVFPPFISCDGIDEVSDVCTCDVGTPNCGVLDDQCGAGSCNEATGRCERMPAHEGEPCDDGNECTTADQCVNGFCVGSNCPDPSLCLVAEDALVHPGSTLNVTMELGAGETPITGGQFVIEYDPTALQFDSALPGSACDPSSPFISTLFLEVDEVNGEIFHAVVVTPGAPGVQEPATMACLSFVVLTDSPSDICLVPGESPTVTRLMDDESQSVNPDNGGDCPTFPPSLSCDTYEFETVHLANLEVFYNGRFENEPDPSRSFLASGSTATVDNITNYVYGITGLRVFFDGVVEFATTPAAAFTFEWTTLTGTTFSPVTDVETAISITADVQSDATVVTIVPNDDHVRRRWLKVTIDADQVSKAGVRLDGELSGNPVALPSGEGLAGGDSVFYTGNLPGDVDADRKVLLTDCGLIRAACNPFLPVPITNVYDVDKDGKVLLTDPGLARMAVNPFFKLPLIEP